MDAIRRSLLGQLARLSAGAALVPFSSLAQAGINQQPARREGDPTKRYGMLIDLRQCIGCQACTVSCHIENAAPLGQFRTTVSQYEVQHQESGELATFMLPRLCNHCENPPCCRACPTKDTFKRKSDGIVMMDFHRCIGCRFCMAACPFGSRSFNFRDPRPGIPKLNKKFPTRTRGVVEKCNFCAERLAVGKMPYCVEASNGALAFGDLYDPDSTVRQLLKENYTIRRKQGLGTEPSVYYIV